MRLSELRKGGLSAALTAAGVEMSQGVLGRHGYGCLSP